MYLGLARKYRPQTFQDLVGQPHIQRTLTNAIRLGRTSQGYVFTGTRGVGKTSVARIFAKSLRCQSPIDFVPCGQCSDCVAIAEGRSVDVLEIDGASNNGVDAVRELRENAKYLPSSGKNKIYIIDEVHMLSTAAFNALLKTLEEPPAHVLFILATTEPQKIPVTILSRCQRFDFRRVSRVDLERHLQAICSKESLQLAPEAMLLLIREADGSIRDALSLLDQVLAIIPDSKVAVTEAMLVDALGFIDRTTILRCARAILERRPLDALECVGHVYLHGFELKQFTRELLRLFRQIMVTRLYLSNAPTTEHLDTFLHSLDLSELEQHDLKPLFNLRPLEDIDLLFQVLHHGLEQMAQSPIPKIILDLVVLKMATFVDLIPVAALDVATASTIAPVAPAQPTAAATAPTLSPTPTPMTLPTVDDWHKAVQFIRQQRPMIGSILENLAFDRATTKPEGSSNLVIVLSHTKDHLFYREQLDSKAYQGLILPLLKNFFGRPVALEYIEVRTNQPLGKIEAERKQGILEERRRAILESEALKATSQLLGARLESLTLELENQL